MHLTHKTVDPHTMDLKNFRHAIALAEAGNFVRAADAVHLTQSALSRSIQSLEHSLGVRLFDRTSLGIKPTTAGKLFLERAQHILYEARTLAREIELIEAGIGGDIGIGAGPAPAISVLPSLLKHTIEHLPQLRVTVEINDWQMLCERLRKETIEFFLIDSRSVGPEKNLHMTPLAPTQCGAAFCRPGHPLAKKRKPSLKQLSAFAIATTTFTGPVEAFYREFFQLRTNDRLPFKLICDSVFLLLDIVASTDTILIASRDTMTAALAAGTVIELPVDEFQNPTHPFGKILAVTLAGRSMSPAATYLIQHIQENLSRAGHEGSL